MNPDYVLFAWHLLIGMTVSLTVALFWAKRVATQATVVRDTNSSAQVVTYRVDHRQFLRTWALWSACLTGVWTLFLIVLETRESLIANGYIAG